MPFFRKAYKKKLKIRETNPSQLKLPATIFFLYQVTESLLEMGCYEVSLADTIGVGTPGKSFSFFCLIFLKQKKSNFFV